MFMTLLLATGQRNETVRKLKFSNFKEIYCKDSVKFIVETLA